MRCQWYQSLSAVILSLSLSHNDLGCKVTPTEVTLRLEGPRLLGEHELPWSLPAETRPRPSTPLSPLSIRPLSLFASQWSAPMRWLPPGIIASHWDAPNPEPPLCPCTLGDPALFTTKRWRHCVKPCLPDPKVGLLWGTPECFLARRGHGLEVLPPEL